MAQSSGALYTHYPPQSVPLLLGLRLLCRLFRRPFRCRSAPIMRAACLPAIRRRPKVFPSLFCDAVSVAPFKGSPSVDPQPPVCRPGCMFRTLRVGCGLGLSSIHVTSNLHGFLDLPTRLVQRTADVINGRYYSSSGFM